MAAPSVRADEADDAYAVPAVQYQRRQFKYAVEGFESYLNQYPDHVKANTARFQLAESLVELGRLDDAAARYDEYLQRAADGSYARSSLFRLGEMRYLTGKSDQAKPLLEQFLAKYPNDAMNAYTLPYLGNMAIAAKDMPTAEKYFRASLEKYPEGKLQDTSRFGLAQSLEKQGKREEAERLYQALAAKIGTPLAEDAQFRLGATQYGLGKYQDALTTFDAFENRLAQSHWQPTARLGHGWALLKLNRYSEALPYFEKAATDPQVATQARYWLGQTQKSLKDYATAAKTLVDAAEADPKSPLVPNLRYQAGDALLRADRPADAAEQFDIVLNTAPVNHAILDDALRGKVQAALKAKDHDSVDRLAAEFATRFPDSSLGQDVRRLRARSLLARKDFQGAAEILKSLVDAGQQGDEGSEDRYLLSLAYEGLGRKDEALSLVAPVATSASGQLQADAQLAQASLLVGMKRYQEAIGLLEAFLATKPEDEAAVKGMGQLAICYARSGQMKKAQGIYGDLITQYPKHALLVPITEQVAEAAYDAGELTWAELLYRWLGHDKRTSDVEVRGLAGQGWAQFKAGRWEDAAATFEQVLAKKPDAALGAEVSQVRGQALEKLGRREDALAMYDQVIGQYPQSKQMPDALWAAARLRDDMKQDAEAVALYARLAKDFPDFPQRDAVFYQQAWALADLGQTEEAAKVRQQLLDQHPQSTYAPDSAFRLAEYAFAKGDLTASRERVTTLLAGNPPADIRRSGLYLQGQIAAAEHKWDEVRQVYESLLQATPDNNMQLLAENGIAESIFRQGEYQEALGRFERLAAATTDRRDTWVATLHLRIAQALALTKQWKRAYEEASKIEKDFPGFADQFEADYVVGRSLSNQAEFEAARKAYLRVVRSREGEKTETAAKAQFMTAESYYHQKNYQSALREYTKVEILYAYPTWQAASLLQSGKCHEMLGEWNEARTAYERILQDYPQAEVVAEAQKRLDAARQRPDTR
jgi:TolA-binding protein